MKPLLVAFVWLVTTPSQTGILYWQVPYFYALLFCIAIWLSTVLPVGILIFKGYYRSHVEEILGGDSAHVSGAVARGLDELGITHEMRERVPASRRFRTYYDYVYLVPGEGLRIRIQGRFGDTEVSIGKVTSKNLSIVRRIEERINGNLGPAWIG